MKETVKPVILRVEKTKTLSAGKFVPSISILEYNPREGQCRKTNLTRIRRGGKTTEEYLNEQAEILENYARQLRSFAKDDTVKHLNLGIEISPV